MPDAPKPAPKPKPPALDLGWHWPTPAQVWHWAIGGAALLVQFPGVMDGVWTHAPWLRGVVLFLAFAILVKARGLGDPSAQKAGELLAAEVERRTSTPPTTPAREARETLQTQRGDVPTTVAGRGAQDRIPTLPAPEEDVDQEAPTRPGGGT